MLLPGPSSIQGQCDNWTWLTLLPCPLRATWCDSGELQLRAILSTLVRWYQDIANTPDLPQAWEPLSSQAHPSFKNTMIVGEAWYAHHGMVPGPTHLPGPPSNRWLHDNRAGMTLLPCSTLGLRTTCHGAGGILAKPTIRTLARW